MKRNLQNLLPGIVVILFGVWIYVATIGVTSFAAAQITPQAVPHLTANVMFVLGGLLIIKSIIGWKKEIQNPVEKQTDKAMNFKELIIMNSASVTFLLVFLYIFLLKRLGFIVCTTLYLTAQITILSSLFTKKDLIKNFVVAIIMTILVFFIFNKGFALALPVNTLGF